MYNMSRFKNRERRKQILLSEIAERVSQRLDESLILEDFYKSLVEEHGFDEQSALYIVEDVQALSEGIGDTVQDIINYIKDKLKSSPSLKKGMLIASLIGALSGGALAQSGGEPMNVADRINSGVPKKQAATEYLESLKVNGKLPLSFDVKSPKHIEGAEHPSDRIAARDALEAAYLQYVQEMADRGIFVPEVPVRGRKPGVAYETGKPSNQGTLNPYTGKISYED